MTTAYETRGQDFSSAASLAPSSVDELPLREQRLRARLEALRSLEAGWDGRDARPPDALALALAWRFITQTLRAALPEPEVFPAADGSVQLEWAAGPVEVELEIEPGAEAVIFVCDDHLAEQQIDGELPRDLSRFNIALARLNAHR